MEWNVTVLGCMELVVLFRVPFHLLLIVARFVPRGGGFQWFIVAYCCYIHDGVSLFESKSKLKQG